MACPDWRIFIPMSTGQNRLLLKWLLGLCLVVLFKFIVLKRPLSYYPGYFLHTYSFAVIHKGWTTANLVPFATIDRFYNSRRLRTTYKVDNLGGNIFGFLPVGFLLMALQRKPRKYLKVIAALALMSLFFEITQLLTGLGALDIDDVLLNTLGGMLGAIFFQLIATLVVKRIH